MHRNTVLLFVDQASAEINAKLSSIPMRLGEIPEITLGVLAGEAVDFLQRNEVPVVGYQIRHVHIILVNKKGDTESTQEISFVSSIAVEDRQNILNNAIRAAKKKSGTLPKQSMKIGIQFLYDETQITD